MICKKVMTLPLTTPCAHNFCKAFLEGKFVGQKFVNERTSLGGRTLRARKNVMKCPCCPSDISDFLQNPQVNRDMMDVIESLQHLTKAEEENSMEGGGEGSEEKEEVEDGDTELCPEEEPEVPVGGGDGAALHPMSESKALPRRRKKMENGGLTTMDGVKKGPKRAKKRIRRWEMISNQRSLPALPDFV